MKAEHTVYAFITLLTEASTDTVNAGLVRLGFKIGTCADNGNLVQVSGKNGIGCILNLVLTKSLDFEAEKKKLKEQPRTVERLFLDQISDMLNEKEVKYFSIIVNSQNPCAWVAGNVKSPEAPQPIYAGPYRTAGEKAN